MAAQHTGEPAEQLAASAPDTSAHMTGHRQTMTTATPTATAAASVTACSLHTLLGMSQRLELRQIELIYRAEGNANLVLALPQFKKVLRLPKTPTSRQLLQQQHDHVERQQKQQQQQQQQQQQATAKEQSASEAAVNQNAKAANPPTMADYAAYMALLRRFVGAAYVPSAEVVAIARESDRRWINAHIRQARPAHRRDKEFGGQFGLLLPDATQLPGALDVLRSNLQPAAKLTGDTYAVEIKPKQGWLLPSDVNDLFCRAASATTDAATAPKTSETTAPTPAPAPAPAVATSTTSIPATTTMTAATTPGTTATATATMSAARAAARAEATAIPAGPAAKMAKTDSRCRYCSMQSLKLESRKISKVSAYCPIELFSARPARMLAALQALFECPQNNLRVFRNGNLIYGDHTDSLSLQDLTENIFQRVPLQLIKQLLVMCLLREYDSGGAVAGAAEKLAASDGVVVGAGQPPAARQHSTTTAMATATVVAHAARTASHAPAASAKDAATTTADVNPEAIPSTRAQLDDVEMLCLPKNCVLARVLHLQLLAKHNLRFMHAAGYARKASKSYATLAGLLTRTTAAVELSLAPAEAYLLGATALDCSIMLAFREVSSESSAQPNVVRLPDGSCFLTQITLVDLDPKPDSHFHKYVRQTGEAAQAAAATIASLSCGK